MSGWEKSAVTLATFLPAAGALVVALVPSKQDRLIRALGVLFTGAALGVGIVMLFGFDFGRAGLQFQIDNNWISTIQAHYHVGVDGISLPLFELTLLLSFLCAVYTFRILPDPGRPKGFLALMMLLETGMTGTFIAFDLILFFIFWELVLVPMYFLIAIWGSENRAYASIKFFLYTLFGSVFMLLGFLAIFFKSNPHTFDVVQLQHIAMVSPIAKNIQVIIFAGLFLGFAIKVPMWPFHTWLPDAHTEAPTVGSVLLAGILLKMGAYGFIRIALPILPQASRIWAPAIAILAVIAIVYASLCCLAQRDLKRLIAFSSVGHMGFVMLGIATLSPIGINAAIFGMVAHGLITGMLFFEVGSIYDRYHTRQIAEIGGGMLQKIPKLAGIFAFTAIASLGLPGLAGFWGEVTALLSSYSPARLLTPHLVLYRTLMVFGGVGTILTAGYFLWTLQRVNMGAIPETWQEHAIFDVTSIEWLAWAPLLAGILLLGLYPRIVFGTSSEAVSSLLRVFSLVR